MTANSATLGIVMLCHTALDRAAEVARHWTRAGCPVVIHVDSAVPHVAFQEMQHALADVPLVQFSKRFRCEWGTWNLVAASQTASAQLLDGHEKVNHVLLTSGACLPLRPVEDLIAYLAARPDVDFIESATIADVPWTVGGLDEERFTLHFPFSWRKQRALFDRAVALQRRLGLARRIPDGLTPHLGSQWWCLTRQSLTALRQDPKRACFERYFKRVWIPDESYFQTLIRRYGRRIESRSLTLSKFDFQGKPHMFYDDHLQMLRRSECFVARKIWPQAQALYDAFLSDRGQTTPLQEPNPGKIDRVFAKATARRTRGRPGLYMQSRHPNRGWENGHTAEPYGVLQGFDALYHDFGPWLSEVTRQSVHGHIFAPGSVEFASGAPITSGALPAHPKLRDANPKSFLTNLIWNTRGQRQAFFYGPQDNEAVLWTLAQDPNATIAVISGAWAIPLFPAQGQMHERRQAAARLQKREADILYALRAPEAKAQSRIWTLADYLSAPNDYLNLVLRDLTQGEISAAPHTPPIVDLTGFGAFLQDLKNQGMHPYLLGDFHAVDQHKTAPPARAPLRRAYVVS